MELREESRASAVVPAVDDVGNDAAAIDGPEVAAAAPVQDAPAYRHSHRRGCPEEILVTIEGCPDETLREVVADDVPGRLPAGTGLVQGVRRLRVDPTSLWVDRTHDHDVLMWAAALRTNPLRRRRATLRMFGSPSTNVTVLTLTPVRPRRFATRAFVRNGWRAMTELRDRIDHRPGGEVRHGPPRQRAVFGSD